MQKQICILLFLPPQATLQSTAVQEYDYRLEDVLVRVRKLQAALEEWERKADDLPRLGDTVWSAGDEVAAVEKRVRPKLAAIRDTALRCRLVLEVSWSRTIHPVRCAVKISLNIPNHSPRVAAQATSNFNGQFHSFLIKS